MRTLSFSAEKTSRPNCGGCDEGDAAAAAEEEAWRRFVVGVFDKVLFIGFFLPVFCCCSAAAFPPKNAKLVVALRQASPPKSSSETGGNGEAAAAAAALRIDLATFSRSFLTSSKRLSEDFRAAESAGFREETMSMSAKARGREGEEGGGSEEEEEEGGAAAPNENRARGDSVAVPPPSSLFSRRRPARRHMEWSFLVQASLRQGEREKSEHCRDGRHARKGAYLL